MRFLVLLLLVSCGTTLDGGIHAAPCGTEAAGLPLCKTSDRCTTAADCIPACTFVGCLEGTCTYRTGTCESSGCSAKATPGGCMECALTADAAAPLTSCVCAACAAACGNTGLCSPTISSGPTDTCAACAIEALVFPGLCARDSAFQTDCFDANDPACRRQAQGIVACRR